MESLNKKNILVKNNIDDTNLKLDKNNIELEFENIKNYNDYNENITNEKKDNQINEDIVIKKKKGRKSKKDKLQETEQIKIIEPEKIFPTLIEKIFDVIKINNCEYYYDREHNIFMDNTCEPKGYMLNKKYIFYDVEFIKKIEIENNEVIKIMKKIQK